ncbi:hypothetical protein Pfo_008692 [Paulownia fortunei]|nr:hypothetical protein Pfo_008692 [Paulownia fortunei]
MANHGAKFVSVNLNKSYGQQHQPSHHTHYPHFNGGGSYGQAAAAGRGRPGSGGGGGMLVLSRNRAGAPKVVPKLSVPPPLNLPSLRKEHEKFDPAGPGGPGAGAGTGSGSRPTSSGVGWTKPVAAATALPEKNESGVDAPGVDGMNATAGAGRGIGSYMPPSARPNGVGVVGSASASRDFPPSAEKAMLLRGEDFPSLQAARPVSSGTSQKQKDGLNQKQKQVVREELTQDKEVSYHLGPLSDMHPLGQSSRNTGGNRLVENGGEGHGMGSGRMADQIRKQEEYLPDPLPLVHMNPRSDWADDERDTGHGFVEQGRDIGFSNSESYWDRDFDLPRPSVLPHKPAPNQYDRWGQRDNETGKNFSSEVIKMDPYNKDVRAPSREGKEVNKWRTPPHSKDGFSSQEIGNYRVDVGARMAGHNNMVKENRYIPPHYGDIGRDGSAMLNRDSAFGRRDLGLVGQQQQQRNNTMESFNNRGAERNSRDRHVTEQSYRYRGDNFQNNTLSKSSLASSGKMHPITDPILNMGRDKRFSNSDRPFSEDPFLRDFGSAGFDERDLFSEGLVGVIKRKKDAAKSTDFHDPVRESFEAELERVQKMQELERQRIIEEQERALEQARREEEERQRRIREEEERRRRLEEEAREAAWRAEQERLEAIQRAEEQRIAREDEKRRIHLEEERRKQAAKQKLQELEARMAKRQAEAGKGDASASKTIVDEKLEHISRNLDLDTWEDGERMVENVMTSGSFDSSAHSRPVEMSSRPYPPREGSSNFLDRGKAINSWKRDVLENAGSIPSPLSDQETGHYSPRRDAFGGGRAAPRKEFHGGAGYVPSRAYLKAGVQEPYSDEFGYQKDHRWNLSGNADSFGKFREMDSEFHDSIADKYGDSGWGQGRSRGYTRPPYPERLYPHSEANELYSYGRSRYSMRQPRVLPPPSLASAQRTNLRGVTERAGPSTFLDNGIHYMHAERTESTGQTAYYDSNQGGIEPSEIFGLQQENSTSEEQKLNDASRCDSQSSLSVSSPPTSPPHLSHDELDESGDSHVTSAVAEGKRNLLTGSGSVVHNGNSGNGTIMMVSDSASAVEDEEWTLENDNTMQQQEEYDEDEDGYREEDEVRERDDENLELNQKFEGLELEEGESPHVMDNVVLGFDEGVEVVIPSDDFEKNLGTQERSFGILESSVGIMEERGNVDGFPSDEHNILPADYSHGTTADSSSAKLPEKSVLPGSIGQNVVAPYSSAMTDLLDGADSSGSTRLAARQTVSSSGDVTAATSQTNNMPSLSSAGSQGDLPVKLQFGLFSGPSLIPAPVPAIQIGSIQMPLHIHPPVGPSITHMHPSQPPMFQFGQLRYTSPISQGILPMAPQSMSFVQPNMLGHFNLNQNAGGSVTYEPARDASTHNVTKDEVPSLSINNQPSFVSASPEQSSGSLPRGLNTVLNADSHEDSSVVRSSSSGVSGPCDVKTKSESGSQAEEEGQNHVASKSYLQSSKARGSESQLQHVQPTVQSVAGDKNFNGLRGLGPLSGGRGRRFAYAVKNAHTRSYVQDHDLPADSNGFPRRPRRTVQRTEFRIRENNDRRPTPVVVSSNNAGLDDKSNYIGKAVGVFTRSGSKRGTISNRIMKQRMDSEPSASGNVISHEVNSGDRAAKEMAKDLSIKSQNTSHRGEANLRRNASEEDVDAPLQSGVVRIFKQPGIEAPSDEDDFIEVRSKRQMLNDRREQREKEIKSKSRTTKPPRKPRASRPKDVVSRSHNKLSVPLGSEEAKNSQLDFTASESPDFANSEVSTGFTTAASQPPIGTPAINSETQAIKSIQAGSVSVVSNGGADREPGLMFDSKNKVMSLSQTQIDEAMKPARYDSHISAVGGHSSKVSDPILPTSSILTKDKTFSSGASPINSLLAGEKIQFGAVTSPTVLPPSSRVVSHGIGAPGSNRTDVQMSLNFPVSEKDDSLFFEKEKHLTDSCVPLQDCEAEAEAAASAVAVAAISSDEIVGNGLGSVNDTKSYGAGIDCITTGVVGDQHLASQSQGEELLSVSLPADLSVETTPISLWPPLPSPQSSSSQMLSHFPTGPPSHFPFYEMNPLLGGPIFAFSPHEESSGTQSQPPKSTASSSGPLGNWQPCHSGVDSFYGAPAGYSGPFIGPPGGIPGVQGPPHMVVYNHFAPVGQYGQVGLSFMGATYIPSGKQADWKNTPTSSAMHIGEGDINNVNMATVQRSAPNMTAPIQHLAPGSPLLPMPPPLPMFDVSPFQTAPDLPVPARWGHIPASPLHSLPVSRPLQPQVEGALPSQVNHGHSIDQSLTANRFIESRTPTPLDNGPSFTVAADTNVAPFPAELGLVDSLRSTTASSGQSVAVQISPGSANAESGKTDTIENGKHQNASSVKTQFSKKNASTQQGNTTGYNFQRGGISQRNHAGNELSHRRMGFHGRNQSTSVDKGFPASKMKQIYVAKQTTSGSSTT